MIKKLLFVISLCTVLVCYGCGDDSHLRKDDADNGERREETEFGADMESHEDTEMNHNVESAENVKAFFETVTDEMLNTCDTYPSFEEYWNDSLVLLNRFQDVKYVVLSDDTEIEGYEWMQCDGELVLRVKIWYKEEPENAYRHKEDYFLFINENEEVSQVLVVDYENKGIHIRLSEGTGCTGNHFLGEGCDFDACFEDVTFDGRKDLIIFVGNSRHASYYCAYIWEGDGFRYEKTFEHIPSYEIKKDEKVICGSDTDGMGEYVDVIYEYKNGEFVPVDYVERE